MMRRLLPAIVLVMMCTFAAPLSVAAFDAFPAGACPAGSKQEKKGTGAVACADSACTGSQNPSTDACTANPGNPLAGPDGLLIKVTHIIAYLGGAIAVIMIIVGSIRFITSGSDLSTGSRTDTDVEEAKATIANALIGLAVIVLAQYIISFVIVRL